MKIKMKTLAAGPLGNKHPNVEYDVPDQEGKDLVSGGYAVEIKEEPLKGAPKPAEPPIETAEAPPAPERAVPPGRRKRP